jgi:Zn-dependent peptidase ImmA (M78 family)
MKFAHYHETVLEQWINDQYRSNQILSADDLDISRIAAMFSVDLCFDICRSFSDNNEGVIILDKRESLIRSRMVFFHELCHVLRHVGDQRKMPELFRDAQEADANAFLLYASMPFYMIDKLNLPVHQNDVIDFLASTFDVPMKLAKERLEQIQRREFQGIMMAAAKQHGLRKHTESAGTPPPPETKIYAYYDPTGEFDAPSQLIVEVDTETMLNHDEIIFAPDGPFERIEENQLDVFDDSKPVLFADMTVRDDKIGVRLSNLAARYRNAVHKFVIQKKEIEEVLHFHGAF